MSETICNFRRKTIPVLSNITSEQRILKKGITMAIILFCGGLVNLYAGSHSVSGRVLDAQSREAIDFANVSLYKPGSNTPIVGTTTDNGGKFLIEGIDDGKFKLVVSFLGYRDEARMIDLKSDNPTLSLGKIYLRENAQSLDEVEVVGQGPTMRFELDKKVFTVDQNIAAAGGSATDALENIPSVDIDQEGNISLRNSEAVEVWINGKPSGLTSENRAQVLEQMPAAGIKEIEIITNPSAKYSPEGTAGIINIVTKRNKQAGYFGSLTGRIDYCMASPWNVPPGGNLGLNFNFNKSIIEGYFNAGYNYHVSNGASVNDRYNFINGDTTRLIKDGTSNRNSGGLFLRAGLDFRITDKSTIGISGFGIVDVKNDKTNGGFSHRSYAPTEYRLYDVNHFIEPQSENNEETLTEAYSRDEKGQSSHPGWNARLDWQYNISEKHRLAVSSEVFNFPCYIDNIYQQRNYEVIGNNTGNILSENTQEQLTTNNMPNLQLKADYEWKPTKLSRFEAGWQTDLGWRQSVTNAWNGTDKQTQLTSYYNDFINNEQTHALYLTYGNRFWNKLSVQVGIRGEYFKRHLSSTYYDTDANITSATSDTSYLQFFPSAYISYSFKNGHELQLNYTRRIDRPRRQQINPRQNFSDSTNIQYGNVNLLPQYSSSLELNYLKMWDNHTLSAGLFYRYADDIIQNIKYIDGTIMRNTFINAGKRHEAGIEMVAKNKLFKEYIGMTTSVNVYYNRLDKVTYTPIVNGVTKNEIIIPEENILVWSARLNFNFLFTKTFTGQLSGRYRSPQAVAQGKTSHSYSIDLSLRKTFLNKKLALAFNVRDLLNSRARQNTAESKTFWQYSSNRWNSRMVSLSLTYNFGTGNKPKKPDNRENETAMDIFDEGGDIDM